MTTHLRAARCLTVAVAVGVASTLLMPVSAQAAGGTVSTTGTSVVSVRPSTTTTLTGLSVSDTDSTDTLQVSLSTDLGTIAVGTTTGLTLDYGYSTFSGAAISFTGSPSAVNAAVGSATLTTTTATGTAHVSLSAMVSAPSYIYSPTNGHFYTFVSSPNINWTSAQTAAAALSFNGQPGYLATMPTAATNDVVANRIPGATNAWIGAKSTDTPSATIKRTWKWDDGPVAGQVINYCSNFSNVCDFTNNTGLYSSWASGEPNNSGNSGSAYSGEWTAVTNYSGTHGAWNDFPGTSTSNLSGYIVEYGDRVNGSSGFTGVSTATSSVRVSSAPDAPTGVSAARGDQQATVSFTAPAANGSPITGYTVTSSPGAAVGTCAASPCTVTGLTNGTAYTFTVTATNDAGTSLASSASSAVTPAGNPGAPTAVSATRGDQQATVTFSPGSANGSAVTGWLVKAFTGGVATVSSPCSAQPCAVTGLTNGTAYTFTVRAINDVGTSLASDPSDAVTPAGVPAAPTGVSAARGNGSAEVSFTAPSANGSPISSFAATSSPGGLVGTCTASPCTVSGLTNGTAYTFTVTATNGVGASVASAASTAVTPAAVPDPPTGVSATRGDQQAVVSFVAPAAHGDPITGYSVRAVSGGTATTSACSASPCTVTGLTNGTSYTFTVKATNAVGSSLASDPSDAVTPAGLPAVPTDVSGVRGDQQATVSFTAPEAHGSPITAYTVTTTTGGTSTTSFCAASPCTVSALTNGSAYTFTVSATNGVGTSAASDPSDAVTPAAVPDAPTGVSAERGDQEALVSFDPPAANGEPITGYSIRTAGAGTATTSSCAASPCTVSGLTNGTSYTFTVRAINAVGSSAASDPSDAVTPAAVPDAPTDVSAARGNESAQVSFTAPSSHGSAITGYTVTSTPDGLPGTCAASPCTVPGLTNGTAYTFTVTATNGAGTSVPSAASGSVTPAAVPDPPTAVSAERGDQEALVSFDPPAAHGDAITGYSVRAVSGGVGTTTPCSASPCTVSGLTNGSAYTFTVKAINAVGSSVASDPSDAVTPAGVTTAPTGVSATRGDRQATVTFTAPPANGTPTTSFTVTATTGGTPTTSPCAGSPCTVTGLSNGSTYTFTVTATNAVGTSAASTASDEVTPATVPDAATDLAVESRDTSLGLTFTPPASDGGSGITGYEWSVDGGQSWTDLSTTGTSTRHAAIDGLMNGTAYVVRVRATNAVGHGAALVSAATTPAGTPGPVGNAAAVVTGASATVTWTAPADDGGAPVASYEVTSDPATTTCTSASTSCTLTGLTPGTSYVFSIVADNTHAGQGATGPGTQASTVSVLVPVVPAVPGSPEALTVGGRDRTLHLGFAPPTDAGTSTITGYQVQIDTGRRWTPLTTAGTTHVTSQAAPVLNGHTYRVRVRAVSDVGPGDPSAVTTVRVATWFADPVSARARAAEIAVPRHPRRHRGRARHTVATSRSASGHPVSSLATLRGRQLQGGQGVQIRVRQLFASGSARLTARGRSRLRSLAGSLTWVTSVACEGYVDYAMPKARGKKLSVRRARVVCAALSSDGVRAGTTARGYGRTLPQIIAKHPRKRGANNRIVVLAAG